MDMQLMKEQVRDEWADIGFTRCRGLRLCTRLLGSVHRGFLHGLHPATLVNNFRRMLVEYCCYEMPDFIAMMHEIEFRLGAPLQTYWGAYNAPRTRIRISETEERTGKGGGKGEE